LLTLILCKSEKVDIDCKYGIESFGHLENINRCLVEQVDIVRHEQMDVNVRNIQSNRGAQYNPGNISGFEAENQPIFFFPGKIGKHFPYLKAVKIISSSLRKITSEDFRFFLNLEFLDLSNNLLLVLEANLFQFTLKLQKVWLKNNKIYYIHPNAFNGLIYLNSLDIYDNTCYTGRARSLQDALTISRLSICSDELLYSCGAFSQALERAEKGSSSKGQNFGIFPFANMTEMIQKIWEETKTSNFNEILNKIVENQSSMVSIMNSSVQQVNQTWNDVKLDFGNIIQKFDEIIAIKDEILNNITIQIEGILKSNANINEILNGMKKDQFNVKNTSDSCNNTDRIINYFPGEDFNKELIANILQTLNDSNHELVLKLNSDSHFIIYVSLLTCTIILLIIILIIVCTKKSSNTLPNYDTPKADVKINDEYNVPYLSQNYNKAQENHYQMSHIGYQQATNTKNQQPCYGEQQEYEEIPENSYNRSQTYYGRAVRNNRDDFYEEQPNQQENYSNVNGGKPTEDYAAVYRPVRSGKKVNIEDDKMLYS